MGIIKKFKIFEASKKIHYPADWMRPGSKIRMQLEDMVKDMMYHITDIGYIYQIVGWTWGQPYIWIAKRYHGHNILRKIPFEYSQVKDTVDMIVNYLEKSGFSTEVQTHESKSGNISYIEIVFHKMN